MTQILVDHHGVTVGAALLKTVVKQEAYEIELLGVSKNRRRKGAGKMLVKHLIKTITSRNPDAYLFVNAFISAKFFYKKLNFIPVVEADTSIGVYVPLLSNTSNTMSLVWHADNEEYDVVTSVKRIIKKTQSINHLDCSVLEKLGEYKDHLLSVAASGVDVELMLIEGIKSLNLSKEQARQQFTERVYGREEECPKNIRDSHDPAYNLIRGFEFVTLP
jgi:hypothetical protein